MEAVDTGVETNRPADWATWIRLLALLAMTAPTSPMFPSEADAAIVLDGLASTGSTTTATATVSHTTGSGTNRLMLVGVSFTDQSGVPAVSSVTYNGVNLTLVGTQNTVDNFGRIEIWRLVAPPSGTFNVAVTFGSAPDSATVGVMTFKGVNQTTPLGTFTSATGDSTTASTTVSSAAGEVVFDTLVVESTSDYNLAPGAGQFERWDIFQGTHANGGGSTEAGAASVQMSWTFGADKWSIGAVPIKSDGITAADVVSFEGKGGDDVADLEWETASELDNLGFHLYRATSIEGPFERITTSLIPGLGSSPFGATYRYRDTGLVNDVTYYYQLEDVETTGQTKRHGPVSVTPTDWDTSAGGYGDENGEEGSSETSESEPRITYGNPSANRWELVRRGERQATLELITEGFYAIPQEDGTVLLEVPNLAEVAEPGEPAIPVYRSWVDALAGRKIEIVSVSASRVETFSSLRPSFADTQQIEASRTGAVRRRRRDGAARRAFEGELLIPSETARLITVAFQQKVKKALVEVAPLRWDPTGGGLLLARRVVVWLSFQQREPSEDRLRVGRRARVMTNAERRVLARLVTVEKGLYGLPYENVSSLLRRDVPANSLTLSRLGHPVASRIEPDPKRFGRGSTLYFLSEGAEANPYGPEAVYELSLSDDGLRMGGASATPSGEATPYYWKRVEREENRFYQAGLVDAPDLWLWEPLFAPERKRFEFEVKALAETPEPSRIEVWLQGTSDFEADPDHHVLLWVNGALAASASWDGKREQVLTAEIGPGSLREGENVLELQNVGDTQAPYSMVMLNRYAVSYPSQLAALDGHLEGTWSRSGTALVSGLGGNAHLLDVTEEETPRWLQGARASNEGWSFRAEAGRKYLAVGERAVRLPTVKAPATSWLENRRNQADYVVIGPRDFLTAAEPLLQERRRQGLRTVAVPIEAIYEAFGYGESTPESIREFLSYAYHNWQKPSPRYVLLLGDATFDYKDYLETGVVNRVPPLLIRTTYLWTVSDPMLAAVNGDDPLPDVAIGRLPASTVEEVQTLVTKILAYESGDARLSARNVLVADNPDEAGDFQADAEDLASSLLEGAPLEKIYLSELGPSATTEAILQAFDEGASVVSYIGHGGIQLWAHEDIFHTGQAAFLTPQSQQPVLLTMNCLNGYFHFPYFNSLAEDLVKAEGKGAIAAFSPSGMSLNVPAHQYHRALLKALLHGGHERLGDAVLQAQSSYLRTGVHPELLSIYHLLGDPALKVR